MDILQGSGGSLAEDPVNADGLLLISVHRITHAPVHGNDPIQRHAGTLQQLGKEGVAAVGKALEDILLAMAAGFMTVDRLPVVIQIAAGTGIGQGFQLLRTQDLRCGNHCGNLLGGAGHCAVKCLAQQTALRKVGNVPIPLCHIHTGLAHIHQDLPGLIVIGNGNAILFPKGTVGGFVGCVIQGSVNGGFACLPHAGGKAVVGEGFQIPCHQSIGHLPAGIPDQAADVGKMSAFIALVAVDAVKEHVSLPVIHHTVAGLAGLGNVKGCLQLDPYHQYDHPCQKQQKHQRDKPSAA